MTKIMRYQLLLICLFLTIQKMIVIAQHQSSDSKKLFAETKNSATQKQCRNLICLFDVLGDEELFGAYYFVGLNLLNALHEQVAPIIVTTDNLRNFCYWKANVIELSKKFLLKSFGNERLKNKLSAIITQELVDKDWHCYAHKQAGLMLLIPKKYVETHASGVADDIRIQMEQCGFDVTHLDKISDVSPSTLLQYIDSHERTYYNIIDYFESIFIKQKDQSAETSKWNIYVAGHGTIGSINSSYTLESIAERKGQLRRVIESENASVREIEQCKKELSYLQGFFEDLKKHGVIRRGQIAGLDLNEFFQFISFLQNDIKTSYLHYNTCFSGGFNQALINEELSRINANFIVSAQGINEAITYFLWSPLFTSSKRFTNFFTALERFFCNQDQVAAYKIGAGNDPIAEIVGAVIDKGAMDWNQPFVRIPQVGVFNAFAVDKTVKILTNVIVRAHELENTLINYTNDSIETIFVYPSYVGAPLKINKAVAIVSPAPQAVAQRETIHVFEKVIYNDQLCNVIANFVSFNTRHEPIIFVIKELHCLDYAHSGLEVGDKKPIIIKDMIIHIKGSGKDNFLDVKASIVFSLNAINYSLVQTIQEIQGNNIEVLFESVCNSPVSIINESDFSLLAETIVGRTAMKNFDKNEIGLPYVIKYFDNKVNKSVRVQRPGSLRNVLLLKRLDSLERSTTQEALNEQKEWLKSKNKSIISLIKSLERYKKEAEVLSNEIDVALKGSESVSLHDTLKIRIMNIQSVINKEYELAVSQLSWSEYAAMKMSSFYVPSPYGIAKKVSATVRKVMAPFRSEGSRDIQFSKPR